MPLLVGARGYQEMDQIVRDHIRAMRIQLAAKHAPPEQTERVGANRALHGRADRGAVP